MEVPLTRGQVTLVDDEDYERVLAEGSWYAQVTNEGKFRAARSVVRPDGKRGLVYLHNFILGTKRVDHQNLNMLDNRRSNLRPANQSQNCANKTKRKGFAHSKYKGVRWDADRKQWKAYITVNYKQVYLGRFKDEREAAEAYNCAAVEHFGEFANGNQ